MDTRAFLESVVAGLNRLLGGGRLRGWELRSVVTRSLQRLYSSSDARTPRCHQSRLVSERSYALSVYTSGAGGTVGTAAVDLVAHRPVDDQLSAAVELAGCSRNPAWELAPPPATPPAPVETCDARVRDDAEAVAREIEDRFTAAFARTERVALNSAEVFVNYRSTDVLNSRGLAYAVERSDLYLEAAMERAGTANDQEVHEYITSVTTGDLDVEEFVARCALQVAALGRTIEPATADSCVLVVGKQALSSMLAELSGQLLCAPEYHRYPFLKVGDTFGGGEGDALTFSVDPTIPCLAESGAYTADGLPAAAGTLIEHNRVVDRMVENRYGQYLGLEPNGRTGNLVVAPGTLTPGLLAGRAYLEIVKFSSLLIDKNKLTWSSEIKLGRQVAADGAVTLVKGGVVSGDLRENLTACRLSAEIATVNTPGDSFTPRLGYRGPASALFTRGVSVAGATAGSSAS